MAGRRDNLGVSLVELMISLVAGLIVVGSVLTFTVATVRSNAETLSATRLTQDLRVVINLVTREIRRAGYDRMAELSIGTSSPALRYTDITLNAARDCIVIGYNRPALNASAAPPVSGELKGFRRVVRNGRGIIQSNSTSTPPDCASDTGWVDLTNPNQIDVTSFQLTYNQLPLAGLPTGIAAAVRNVDIQLAASLSNDPAIRRELTSRVRVRADDVVFP